jgi:acetyl-CoA acetyltransferase
MSIKDRTCIVGVGTTDYYKRGQSGDKSALLLCCEAILAACEDAGVAVEEIDGFSSYADTNSAALVAPALNIPEVRYSNLVWGGGGGGSCAAVANASAAIAAGFADVVAVYHGIKQSATARFGQAFARGGGGGMPSADFIAPFGLMSPPQMFALIVQRHMYEYGTKPEHLGNVAVTTREHARRNPKALMQAPLTLDDYFDSRIIAEPLRLFDCCQENDGAGALIVVSAERAKDLAQRPVYVMAGAQGGHGRWGESITDQQMPDEIYATAGHTELARNLFEMAGVGPDDIDVAELYDHFSGMVLLQLEDYGFCGRGESGPFVAEGNTRWPDGKLPVNTHGGNLSEVYLHGTTHIIEGVQQLRGTSTAQVENAEIALVTGGPSPVPSSSLILRR